MIIIYVHGDKEVGHTDLDWIPKIGTNIVLGSSEYRNNDLFYTITRIKKRTKDTLYMEVKPI